MFETNDGRNLSFKINVKTKEEKEKLVKLLSKKYLTLTRVNGEQVKVAVRTDSTHSFILRKGQTEPDEYQFSVDLELFEGKNETEKLAVQLEDKQEISYLSLYISVVLRDFLIEKGILSKEEFNSRLKALESEMKEKMQKSVEKGTEKKA